MPAMLPGYPGGCMLCMLWLVASLPLQADYAGASDTETAQMLHTTLQEPTLLHSTHKLVASS